MVEFDMHIHTNFSDGLWSPEDIFRCAKDKGLKGIAITDHDTVESLDKCCELSKKYEIEFIPGIEISTIHNGYELHVLGYFIDYHNNMFLKFLKDLQHSRENRAASIINILNKLGFSISMDEVINEAGDDVKSIGRPHIGRTLVKKGYFKDTTEVFDNLLSMGRPAYVEKSKVSINEAINAIKKASGKSVLAHPFTDTGFINGAEFEMFINQIKTDGLNGIEVYHTLHSKADEEYLLDIAMQNKLAITGGSDFHGALNGEEIVIGMKGISEFELNKLK